MDYYINLNEIVFLILGSALYVLMEGLKAKGFLDAFTIVFACVYFQCIIIPCILGNKLEK